MSPLRVLSENLFPFERKLSYGEQLYFRIFEVLIAVFSLLLAWQWAVYMQRLERVLKPQGIAHYMDLSFLLGSQIPCLVAGALALCLLLGVVRRSPYAYGAAILLMHVLYAARHSLGKAPHIAHCIGLSLIALALGTALFRSSAAHLQRFVFGFLIFCLGVSYALAGICKLVYTGIGWPDGSHLLLWIAEREMDARGALGSFDLSIVQRSIVEHRVLGTVALAFGLVTELLAFLAWFERLRIWVLSGLIAMHLGIGLTMDIYFSYNVYLLVMLAYPWGKLVDWLLQRTSASSADRAHELH